MSPTATMTAAIITSTCCAMPMAVTIELIENTRSSRMIWTMMPESIAPACCFSEGSCGSSISACISCTAL